MSKSCSNCLPIYDCTHGCQDPPEQRKALTQEQIDLLAESLRSQGLTWGQTNFAISLIRNVIDNPEYPVCKPKT